jgi:hypothetical protein
MAVDTRFFCDPKNADTILSPGFVLAPSLMARKVTVAHVLAGLDCRPEDYLQILARIPVSANQAATTDGDLPFMKAAAAGNTAAIAWLTRGLSDDYIDYENQYGDTALTMAAMNGHADTVVILRSFGAKLTQQAIDAVDDLPDDLKPPMVQALSEPVEETLRHEDLAANPDLALRFATTRLEFAEAFAAQLSAPQSTQSITSAFSILFDGIKTGSIPGILVEEWLWYALNKHAAHSMSTAMVWILFDAVQASYAASCTTLHPALYLIDHPELMAAYIQAAPCLPGSVVAHILARMPLATILALQHHIAAKDVTPGDGACGAQVAMVLHAPLQLRDDDLEEGSQAAALATLLHL